MKRNYPCDIDGSCPYGEGYTKYFCSNNCGLGVNEDSKEQEETDLDREFYTDLRMEQQEQM